MAAQAVHNKAYAKDPECSTKGAPECPYPPVPCENSTDPKIDCETVYPVQMPTITVDKVANKQQYTVGEEIDYTVKVKNLGAVVAYGPIKIIDVMDNNMVLITDSLPENCAVDQNNSQKFTCDFDAVELPYLIPDAWTEDDWANWQASHVDIASGAVMDEYKQISITFKARATKASQQVVNKVNVNGGTRTPNCDQDSEHVDCGPPECRYDAPDSDVAKCGEQEPGRDDKVIVEIKGKPILKVEKIANIGSVHVGQVIDYVLRVTNISDIPTMGIMRLSDVMEGSLALIAGSLPGNCWVDQNDPGHVFYCNIDQILQPGENAEVTFKATAVAADNDAKNKVTLRGGGGKCGVDAAPEDECYYPQCEIDPPAGMTCNDPNYEDETNTVIIEALPPEAGSVLIRNVAIIAGLGGAVGFLAWYLTIKRGIVFRRK